MPRLFIFIGRSGCGKGTQAEMLMKYLAKTEPDNKFLHIETGKLFREQAALPGYTNELIKKGIEAGDRLPDFLSLWNWVRIMVDQFTGKETVILDGSPRSLLEAEAVDTLFRFYPGLQPVVIFLNISRETALDRMGHRGRADDNPTDSENRLNWFEAEVMPAVEHFRSNSSCKFFDIDGEPAPEAIHQAIVSQL